MPGAMGVAKTFRASISFNLEVSISELGTEHQTRPEWTDGSGLPSFV